MRDSRSPRSSRAWRRRSHTADDSELLNQDTIGKIAPTSSSGPAAVASRPWLSAVATTRPTLAVRPSSAACSAVIDTAANSTTPK